MNMNPLKRNLIFHLSIGISLYALFAFLDAYFTLAGLNGDITLEGNPIMQRMMVYFGLKGGLIVEKSMVLLVALILAVVAATGIEKRAEWVYLLAFTAATRRWMKRKRRRWVAFIPVYFVAAAQGLAAASWVYLMVAAGVL